MSPPRQPMRGGGFHFDPAHIGPVTKGLCIAMVTATVVFSVTQRTLGFGVVDLAFSVDDVLRLQLWRLFTYPFVYDQPFGLLVGVVVLFFLGRWFEAQHGSRDFLRFFAASSVGAALIAIPLHFVLNLGPLFRDVGLAVGAGPAIDAMLMAIALNAPDSNILFGFVLPMRARTMVWMLIGLQVITGLMTGTTALSVTLGGLAMGYLLITGRWRPSRWLKGRRPRTRVRHGLYVVPPKDNTLH